AQLDPARLEIVRTMAQHGLQSIDGVRVLVSQAVDVRLEKGDADDLLDDRVAERCLVRKVMVHRALRYARALQDRIHTRSLEPVQVKLLERRSSRRRRVSSGARVRPSFTSGLLPYR